MSPATILQLSPVYLLMGSVVLVSLIAWTRESIKRALMLNPYSVGRGQVYRLLTAGWVHGDAAHLIFNMLALHIFADRVVAGLGVVWFLLLYVSAVIVAFIPTTLRYLKNPRYNSIGASGATSAVMLSAILLDPSQRLRLLFFPVALPGIIFAVLYLVYSAAQSRGSRDGINHDAHFSGAVYGMVVTFLLVPDRVVQSLRAVLRMVGM